ncbi:hypothetical protein D3C81_698250 [compost metagenome]
MFRVALVWRRLPFTSTSTWAAFRPRRLGARAMPLASQPVFSGRVKDGMVALRASIRPGLPVCCSCLALITSIGTGLVVTVRFSEPRLPVTITVPSCAGSEVARVSSAKAPGAATAVAPMATASSAGLGSFKA